MVGRMALECRLCTDAELSRCRKEQRQRIKANEPATLEQLLLEYGFITGTQADRLKTNIKESKDAASQIPGYKVLGKLGSGAMAVVYKAKQLSLDRTVAVKVLPRRFTEKSDYVSRFFKEGKIAAKLNHNNIVQAIDVGEAGGLYYFVMEYVEGKTLYDDLSKGRIFSDEEALEIVMQLAHALAHAHANGMIHRDVKPKNIMINTAGVVKLADMGLARETSDVEAAKNEEGKAFGTPYYIAPEQIRGEVSIDGRADIYALGATFFHMVTGRVPFEASTPAEVMKKHLREPLVPPDHLNTAVSSGVAEVIEVMMAKNKQDRYSNVEELLIDLESVRNGYPPSRAKRKFSMDTLEELEEGAAIETSSDEDIRYAEEKIARYRVMLVVVGAIAAVCAIALLFVLFGSGEG